MTPGGLNRGDRGKIEMRWLALIALVLTAAAAFGCEEGENGPSVVEPTLKASATATASPRPTRTPRPSRTATATPGSAPTPAPSREPTAQDQSTATATATATISPILAPPTATPYIGPTPYVPPTPVPTPTPLPDPRRTVEGTGPPSGCFPTSPNPSEAPLDLGEPTRYARGIYSIGVDASALSLFVDRSEAVVGDASASFVYETYSVTPDGSSMAFVAGQQVSRGRAELQLLAPPNNEPRLLATFNQILRLAIAPQGDRVAVQGSRGDDELSLYVVDTQDGAVTAVPTPLTYSGSDQRWSPDGEWLAIAAPESMDGPTAIYVLHPDGTGLRRLVTGGPPMAWSPDGSRLTFTVGRWEEGTGLYTADLEGHVRKISDSVTFWGPSFAWSPDGHCLAFVTFGPLPEDPRSLRILDVETGWEVFLASDVAHPLWSPDGSRIAFLRGGNLWVMNTDGSQQARLTNPRQPFVEEPFWLPDGPGLFFAYVPPMAESVYIINSDGTDEVNLADGYGPVWSPDGDRIAFYGGGIFGGLGGLVDIYVMDSDGGNPGKVADVAYGDVVSPCAGDSGISWSSDGLFLAYGGNVNGIEVVPSDGSAAAQQIGGRSGASWAPGGHRFVHSSCPPGGWGPPFSVTLSDLDSGHTSIVTDGGWPAWAPDGERIAFVRDDVIHIIKADGTDERTVVALEPEDTDWWGEVDLVWSPDGSRLAIRADGLFVVDIVSGEERELAESIFYQPPTWSPDGTRLAYSSLDDAHDPDSSRIYIINADGTGGPRLLTDGSGPSWSPDGSRIAFAR